MADFSKKKSSMHKTVSIAVVAVYMTVTCAVDLFHNEACQLGAVSARPTDVIPSNDPCPACMFLAGSNSTEPNCGQALGSAESAVISRFLPRLTVVNHDEWACSIICRAPPAIVTP